MLENILRELKIVTGVDFGLRENHYLPVEDIESIRVQAIAWWEREGNRFQEGMLYKHGYLQNVDVLFLND